MSVSNEPLHSSAAEAALSDLELDQRGPGPLAA